jgi:hypothetical protein
MLEANRRREKLLKQQEDTDDDVHTEPNKMDSDTEREAVRMRRLARPLPTRWLTFYTYFRLPFGALALLLSASEALVILGSASDAVRLQLSIHAWIFLLSSIAVSILVIALSVGLARRRIWAWKWNWALLLFEWALWIVRGDHEIRKSLISLVIWSLAFLPIWFIPNALYFSRRRGLFKSA